MIEPSIPPELEAVVLRAMAFDRSARYQTAQEMLDALRPFGAVDNSMVEFTTGRFQAVNPPAPVGTPTEWTTSQNRTDAGGAGLAPRRRQPLLFVAIGALATVGAVGAAAVLLHRSELPTTATSRRGAEVPSDARIELSGLPVGARVWLDGVETRERSFVLRRGSEHRLRVEAPGHRPYETNFVVERSDTLQLALALVPAIDAAAPSTSTSSAPAAEMAGTAGRSSTVVRSGRTGSGRIERTGASHRGSGAVRPAGSLIPAMEEY